MTPLTVKPEPCPTCPYRKDVPSGVWHAEEYERLRRYDQDGVVLGVFLCHQSIVAGVDIVCKGWCVVHQDSIAVRLAMAQGQFDRSALDEPKVGLHESGNAAADFGQRDIEKPKRMALKVVEKLVRTGRFKT